MREWEMSQVTEDGRNYWKKERMGRMGVEDRIGR
jgi:hypothetical protein